MIKDWTCLMSCGMRGAGVELGRVYEGDGPM